MNLELIRWSEEYLDGVARIFTHAGRAYLSDGLPMPYTREHAQDWLERNVLPKDEKTGLYRVILADGNPAGIITLDCKDNVYRRDADIGYLLLPEYSGRGVMTAALRLFCAEAFEKLNILRISARVFSPNTASRRALEKNGFALEGTLRRAVCKGESVYDLCIYGKLREEQASFADGKVPLMNPQPL